MKDLKYFAGQTYIPVATEVGIFCLSGGHKHRVCSGAFGKCPGLVPSKSQEMAASSVKTPVIRKAPISSITISIERNESTNVYSTAAQYSSILVESTNEPNVTALANALPIKATRVNFERESSNGRRVYNIDLEIASKNDWKEKDVFSMYQNGVRVYLSIEDGEHKLMQDFNLRVTGS